MISVIGAFSADHNPDNREIDMTESNCANVDQLNFELNRLLGVNTPWCITLSSSPTGHVFKIKLGLRSFNPPADNYSWIIKAIVVPSWHMKYVYTNWKEYILQFGCYPESGLQIHTLKCMPLSVTDENWAILLEELQQVSTRRNLLGWLLLRQRQVASSFAVSWPAVQLQCHLFWAESMSNPQLTNHMIYEVF